MSDLPPLVGALALSVLAVLTVVLMVVEARRYVQRRMRPHLFWSVGLALVVVSLAIEAIFYAGGWSVPAAQSYFFLVALLVGVLSLGSAELLLPHQYRAPYAVYVAVLSAVTAYLCFVDPIGRGVLSGGVVTGNPSLGVLVASSCVTVPAAAIMVIGSIRSALQLRQWRLLYVAAGILVISAAGALYIVSIPITLYFAEFVGVFLLFVGFGGLPSRHASARGVPQVAGGA
jgi:hypothetical protein